MRTVYDFIKQPPASVQTPWGPACKNIYISALAPDDDGYDSLSSEDVPSTDDEQPSADDFEAQTEEPDDEAPRLIFGASRRQWTGMRWRLSEGASVDSKGDETLVEYLKDEGLSLDGESDGFLGKYLYSVTRTDWKDTNCFYRPPSSVTDPAQREAWHPFDEQERRAEIDEALSIVKTYSRKRYRDVRAMMRDVYTGDVCRALRVAYHVDRAMGTLDQTKTHGGFLHNSVAHSSGFLQTLLMTARCADEAVVALCLHDGAPCVGTRLNKEQARQVLEERRAFIRSFLEASSWRGGGTSEYFENCELMHVLTLYVLLYSNDRVIAEHMIPERDKRTWHNFNHLWPTTQAMIKLVQNSDQTHDELLFFVRCTRELLGHYIDLTAYLYQEESQDDASCHLPDRIVQPTCVYFTIASRVMDFLLANPSVPESLAMSFEPVLSTRSQKHLGCLFPFVGSRPMPAPLSNLWNILCDSEEREKVPNSGLVLMAKNLVALQADDGHMAKMLRLKKLEARRAKTAKSAAEAAAVRKEEAQKREAQEREKRRQNERALAVRRLIKSVATNACRAVVKRAAEADARKRREVKQKIETVRAINKALVADKHTARERQIAAEERRVRRRG